MPAAGGTAGKEADRRGYRPFAPYPVTKAAPGLSAISSSFTSKPPLPLETANRGLFRLSLDEARLKTGFSIAYGGAAPADRAGERHRGRTQRGARVGRGQRCYLVPPQVLPRGGSIGRTASPPARYAGCHQRPLRRLPGLPAPCEPVHLAVPARLDLTPPNPPPRRLPPRPHPASPGHTLATAPCPPANPHQAPRVASRHASATTRESRPCR